MELAPKPRLLPILVVVKRSYAYAWERRAILARPYALYLVLTALGSLLQAAASNNAAITLLVFAASQIFALAFAIGIHRLVLLNEAGRGAGFFRWDHHFVPYVAAALGFALASFAALFLAALFASVVYAMLFGVPGGPPASSGGGSGGQSLISLFAVGPVVLVATFLSRFSLALPSVAIGAETRLGHLWRDTHHNGARLLAVEILVLLPFLALQGMLLLTALTPGSPSVNLPIIALTLVVMMIAPLQVIVGNVALSLQYDFLIRGNGPN